MGSRQYRQYISSSPVWSAKRLERLALDKGQCKRCRSRESLHVHHRTYIRFGGEELMADLVTLCEKCHAEVHNLQKKQPHASLDKLTGLFLGEIRKPRLRTKRKREVARNSLTCKQAGFRTEEWRRDSDPTWIKTSSRRTPGEIRKQLNGI